MESIIPVLLSLLVISQTSSGLRLKLPDGKTVEQFTGTRDAAGALCPDAE